MSYRELNTGLPDALINQDALTSSETAEARLAAIEDRLRTASLDDSEMLRIHLEKARLMTEVDKKTEAFELAKATFDNYMQLKDYEGAVDACDVMFLTEHEQALPALGMGVWLGVTFPIDPDLSIAMLQHIIDETPDDADGAAVAAATAHYLADIRTEGAQRDKQSSSYVCVT